MFYFLLHLWCHLCSLLQFLSSSLDNNCTLSWEFWNLERSRVRIKFLRKLWKVDIRWLGSCWRKPILSRRLDQRSIPKLRGSWRNTFWLRRKINVLAIGYSHLIFKHLRFFFWYAYRVIFIRLGDTVFNNLRNNVKITVRKLILDLVKFSCNKILKKVIINFYVFWRDHSWLAF